jgi:hypothetical protein
MALLTRILTSPDKTSRYIQDHDLKVVEELVGLPGVDSGDHDFVRAAASVPGSILVTTDSRLVAALVTHGIDQEHDFRISSPRDALTYAGPDE